MSFIPRYPNSTRTGQSFSIEIRRLVWAKAQEITSLDRNVWRRDACGAMIAWLSYGQTTQNGWEIDHINPVARGGSDDLGNLQPLQWQNNRTKSDSLSLNYCAVQGLSR